MPIDTTRRVAISQARQGGFSAHMPGSGVVSSSPILAAATKFGSKEYVQTGREWGLAYLRTNVDAGVVTVAPGDGIGASVDYTVSPETGYITQEFGYPIKNDEMLILFRAAEFNGSTTIYQVGAPTQGGGPGNPMIHAGIRRQAFRASSTQVSLVQLNQTYVSNIWAKLFDPSYEDWGYIYTNGAAGYVDGGQTTPPEYYSWDPYVHSGVMHGTNLHGLTPSNTATWGITAAGIGIYTETSSDGLLGIKNQSSNAALAGTYDLNEVGDQIWTWNTNNERFFPHISLPFGKDWTSSFAADGLTL
jgi:hypothetical protein